MGIANGIRLKLKFLGGIFALIVHSFVEYFRDKRGRKLVNRILTLQIYFTANHGLKIIGIVALALGAVTVLQAFTQLARLGAQDLVGPILNIVIVRELGPIITAFIVIARSGTAIAAEIATMNINNEMDAIEMAGIDTLKMIIFPRIAGMIISFVILTIYFNAIGLIGGFIVGNLISGITFDMFMTYVMNSITFADIASGLLKAVIFGMFIPAISIYYGFQAIVPTQVPQVTTKAVVSSIFALFILNVFITVIFYL
jgi:phospholipid/cholesterol/gamma-HCH transport system permease protein